ncbi:hypothetical protein [Xylanibacter brevis]|uniref:hypothetical protein n=1 Tax=Xylanibacter brevis TaxID=83231 RepID=UPI000482C0DA|nr:hypothetical protein [Xylanibacter brevis]
MYIEISRELVTSAERGNRQAIEMLIRLSLAIKYGKHVVFAGVKLLDRIIRLNALDAHEVLQYRKVRTHYVVIGALCRRVEFKAVVLMRGENCRTRNRILINATKADKLEVYEECHLLTENLQDGEFFEYLVREYVKTLGVQSPITYVPQMGGGNTIAKVYKMEIDRGQHFCVAILDSDKKFPTASNGETCKALQKEDKDKYLGQPGEDGQHAFNCSYYVMKDLRELENLIPLDVLRSMPQVKIQPLMKMNFDMSYHDMKDGLLACKIKVGAYQTYLDKIYSFDPAIVSMIDYCADYCQLCANKDEYEKDCGRTKIVGGLGSKIMEQVLMTAQSVLASNPFAGMSQSQQSEWLGIGKKVFEWCCCMNVGART